MTTFCEKVKAFFGKKAAPTKPTHLIPHKIPAPGWVGGFVQNHPEMNYPTLDLSGLKLTDNMDNIPKITRQQRVLWPEFTWPTKPGEKDEKRCFQMFAPDISRIGYDDAGQSWSIICPQQGTWIKGIGTMNVEVTVTCQRGWVDESNKSLAAELIVSPKIWLSPSANQSPLMKVLWNIFDSKKLDFPSEKNRAIVIKTFRTAERKTDIITVRDGLFMEGDLPSFTLHEGVSWSHKKLEVLIGPIEENPHHIVAEFNALLMKLFNLGAGNMLKDGNLLAWNVWVDAPSLVDQKEWKNHANYWRTSIDVDHASPDGDGTEPKFADGTPFSVKQELIKDVIEEIKKFLKGLLGDGEKIEDVLSKESVKIWKDLFSK